jgi:TonB family protein
MTKLRLILFLVLSGAMGAANAQDSLAVTRLVCPTYPELARHSNIEGDVHLRIKIGVDGSITSAQILRGPKLLSENASKNVLSWHYSNRPKEEEVEVTYRYRLEPARSRDREIPDVILQSPTLIEIVTHAPLTIEDRRVVPKDIPPTEK